MYCVSGKYFADLYRNKLSGYADWRDDELGCGFYFNADNIGPYMSLDETCLSNGEVWTFLTNKESHCGKGTLAAAIPGTKSDEIISILLTLTLFERFPAMIVDYQQESNFEWAILGDPRLNFVNLRHVYPPQA